VSGWKIGIKKKVSKAGDCQTSERSSRVSAFHERGRKPGFNPMKNISCKEGVGKEEKRFVGEEIDEDGEQTL